MGYNLFEKIIIENSGKDRVEVGEIVDVTVDSVMIHDFFAPFCIEKFEQMGFSSVFDPEKIVFVYDHLVPLNSVQDAYHHLKTEEFVEKYNIKNIYRSDGVCHQLMHEKGHVKPGKVILGTDSHTVTYGALGCISTGIGYTEMATVLGTGKMWLKVAPVIKIIIEGSLQKGVYAKDVILHILGDIGVEGGNYKVIEFAGSAIRNMSISSRLTLCNMTIEIGAKAGIIEPDEKTVEYLKDYFSEEEILRYRDDEDATYERVLYYKAEDIAPLVACPYNVDNVKKIKDLGEISINQAYIGSCTNGRIEDLREAARILKDNKVHKNVRLIIVPASREVYIQAILLGYMKIFLEAGAIVNHPACGLCCGISGGLLENGERIISTNNRNFYGRMGESKVEIYLGSPATVAASAIEGKIIDAVSML